MSTKKCAIPPTAQENVHRLGHARKAPYHNHIDSENFQIFLVDDRFFFAT